MSFEILEQATTVYAPLNTTIDADRDYYDLTGLDACACNGGAAKTQMQLGAYDPGEERLRSNYWGDENVQWAGPIKDPTPMAGFYQDQQLTPGMLGQVGGNAGMMWILGGLGAAWMLWAYKTPHRAY